MRDLYQLSSGDLIVWVLPRPSTEPILDWVAFYALRGWVGVIDSGQVFDVKRVTRLLRRRTDQIIETLSRIRAHRVLTCFQLLRLLEETPASSIPYIALDFLSTFYDNSIPIAESYRFLGVAIGHLNRLRKHAPVVVCVHPARIHQPERDGLVEILFEMADEVFTSTTPPSDSPIRLL